MKKTILFILIISAVSFLMAADAGVFDQKGVPEFQYKTLYIEGQDFFFYHKQGDDKTMSLNFKGAFMMHCQKADRDVDFGEELTFDYDKINDDDGVTVIDETLWAQVTKYFGLPQVFGRIDFNYKNDSSMDNAGLVLELTAGAGVGRVFQARSVAQVIAVGKILGIEMTNDKVIEVSDIIDSRADYMAKYKDDEMVMYYNAIAEAIGKPGSVMKIMQILTNPIFTISPRQVGWIAVFGYHNWFLAAEDDPYYANHFEAKGDVFFRGEFAKPLNLDKQLLAYVQFNKSLEEKPNDNANIEAGVDFSIDHLCTWNSWAGFSIDKDMQPDNESDMDYEVHVGTQKNIINKLVGGAELTFKQTGRNSDIDPIMDFNIFFKYFIW